MLTVRPRIEILIDDTILKGKKANIELSQLLCELPENKYYVLLLDCIKKEDGTKRPIPLAELNSYLASRLILKGYYVPFDRICLYYLADSISAFSPYDVLRWFFVLKSYNPQIRDEAVKSFFQQSKKVVEVIITICGPIISDETKTLQFV